MYYLSTNIDSHTQGKQGKIRSNISFIHFRRRYRILDLIATFNSICYFLTEKSYKCDIQHTISEYIFKLPIGKEFLI